MVKRKASILKGIPRQVFLVLFIVTTVISIYALRHNNLTMVKFRDAVYTADKNGDDVNGALNNLRHYVYGHMNTNLSSGGNTIKPPIQLKYTYERLQDAAEKQANNNGLYTEAQNYCQQQYPLSAGYYGGVRIPCIANYVSAHGGQKAQQIPTALYEFDFDSPAWSPDLAGWSLVLGAVLFLAFVIKLALDKVLDARLGNKNKSA